ncbi:MAG: hypothetical protein ACFCVK_19640 [Acidimicrobiales bacterium]
MVMLVREEIVRNVETHQGRAAADRDATEAQRREVMAAAAQAAKLLDQRSSRAVERFLTAVTSAQELLDERLRLAVQTAEQNVAGLDQMWSQMHWNTMRAAVRRNGQWATGGTRIDLADQLAKPLLDTVAFAWVDFFGGRALRAVDALAEGLDDASADYIDRFELSLEAIPPLIETFQTHGPATAGAARQLVDQRLNNLKRDVNDRLTTDRRRLNEDVLGQVRLAMKPAFDQAAAVSGRGSGKRMVGLLHQHAVVVAEDMFASVRTQIDELLVELTAYVQGRAESVAHAVTQEVRSMDRLVINHANDQFDPTSHAATAEQLRQLGAQAPTPASGETGLG